MIFLPFFLLIYREGHLIQCTEFIFVRLWFDACPRCLELGFKTGSRSLGAILETGFISLHAIVIPIECHCYNFITRSSYSVQLHSRYPFRAAWIILTESFLRGRRQNVAERRTEARNGGVSMTENASYFRDLWCCSSWTTSTYFSVQGLSVILLTLTA